MCIFYGIEFFFFLSGFCVKNINKLQESREREKLFFLLLSTLPPALQIVWSSAFAVIREV